MPKKANKKTIFEGNIKKRGVISDEESFLEDEEHKGTHEDEELKLHTGEKEADVYTAEGRDELEEDEGEIAPWEEAFMEGASGKGSKATCENCGKILSQNEAKIIEREYRGQTYFFCSEKCAKAGVKKA